MKIIVERLKPKSDLKEEIQRIASERRVTAGCILNGTGSLSQAKFRTDSKNGEVITKSFRKLEIVSLTGTIGELGQHIHVHISGADRQARVFGGHLLPGCIVHTTAELMMLAFDDYRFLAEYDPATGFKELFIKPKAE